MRAMVRQSVEITPPQQFMGSLGVSKQILASALDADGDLLYGDSKRFSWSSSAPDVVSVDEEGTLTSVGWGTATVTATDEASGATGTTSVTVRDAIRVDWSLVLPGGIDGGNVMARDGTIYAGTSDWDTDSSTWHAISPEGDIVWSLPLPYYPAIGSDGTLYLASWIHDEGGRLIAVDPGGSVQWVLEGLERVRASPAIGPDGSIYVASSYPLLDGNPGGRIFALDAEGRLVWEHRTEGAGGSPLIGLDGTIFTAASGGLVAIVEHESSNGGYEGAPWPTVRGDRASTGRAGG